jgi:hypothetical protein
MREQSSCYISFKILNFELINNGAISLRLSESQSYSSKINVKIQTSSSIPDEVSSISISISSSEGKYFRGFNPTIFKFLMIPSLFESNTEEWDTDLKGYHNSLIENPTEGSQVNFSE